LSSSRAAIEAVATCVEDGAGSRALAVRAARSALDSAGRRPEEVELLINAGVYRDENIIEPAMGPFIQRGIGANSSFPPTRGAGTFSFDISNGACGLLTAINVIDGFMRSGAVRSGLVVASDADPDPSRSESYPFAAAGGAVLLRATSNGEGFAWFHARTWSEHFSLYDARVCGTDDIAPAVDPGCARGQRLRVSEREGFLAHCLDSVCRTVEDLAQRGALDLAAVDLVIPAPSVPGFGEALADRLGLPVVPPASSLDGAPRVHTASTAFGIELAVKNGTWARARRILLVAVGAGVTVSVALYERDPDAPLGSAG
jgi:3-oxoacyl-[acyl-carrier-protein] synthase III